MPSAQLRPLSGGAGDTWQGDGSEARLVFGPAALGQRLAAGWYEVRGSLECLDGGNTAALLPSVHVYYAGDSLPKHTELVLPEAGARGRTGMLMLFPAEVEALALQPAIGSARFRITGFCLRRLSRWQALRTMLAGPASNRSGCTRRFMAWCRSTRRRGFRRATDLLFADYRQRVLGNKASEYAIWIRKYDTLDTARLQALAHAARRLDKHSVRISVLMVVGDAPEASLCRSVDSLLEQVWDDWELCVVHDVMRAPRVAQRLTEYARRDPRVRAISTSNADVAMAFNAALAAADGDFIAMLEVGDCLRPQALLRLAQVAVEDSRPALIYSDEDTCDNEGRRSEPHFKPDWNADLLRGQDYLGHLVAVSTSLVREVGGFRSGFEGSLVYDLTLRCSERVEAARIHHHAEILYHRSHDKHDGVTPADAGSAESAGVRAVAEHLGRIGSVATVEALGRQHGFHRVRWPVPQPPPRISLIIPTRDHVQLLRQCVEGILAKSTYSDVELVVVDNRSSESAALHYLDDLSLRERVKVLRYDAPFNYSAINNWAARQCDGPLLGLVNNDVEVISPDWLEEMAGFALRQETGVVGAMLYYPDDTIQHAGMFLGVRGVAGHVYAGMPRGVQGYAGRALVAQELSAVTGACMLVRRAVFDEVGGLDESLPIEFNDVDFCLRVRQRGYRNVWTPFAELYHHESVSRGSGVGKGRPARAAGIALMRERWGDMLCLDPAYSPNLSLSGLNFELAFPPRASPLDP